MDDTSAYWMYRKLSMIVESHYSHFIQQDRDFKTDNDQMFLTHVENTINQAQNLKPESVSAFLQKQNQSLVAEMETRVHKFMNELMSKGLTLSKLTYDMDKNL